MKLTTTMGKFKKAFSKRFKITKKGKVLRRLSGQSHFFSKKSSKILQRKRKLILTSRNFLEYQNY